MLGDIWTKTLWDQRRALLGWGIGLLAVSIVYGAFYPFATTPEYADLIDNLPPGPGGGDGMGGHLVAGRIPGIDRVRNPGSGAGDHLRHRHRGQGHRRRGGERQPGVADRPSRHPDTGGAAAGPRPVHRPGAGRRGGVRGILALRAPIDLEIPLGTSPPRGFQLTLLAMVFGTLALLVGAITGRRGLVIGVTAVVAVVTYLANGLAPQVEAIAWMQKLSPFYWFAGTPTLRDGLDPVNSLLLAAISLVLASGRSSPSIVGM
jgi:ABC-2 type transport system permease protein